MSTPTAPAARTLPHRRAAAMALNLWSVCEDGHVGWRDRAHAMAQELADATRPDTPLIPTDDGGTLQDRTGPPGKPVEIVGAGVFPDAGAAAAWLRENGHPGAKRSAIYGALSRDGGGRAYGHTVRRPAKAE